MSNINQSISTSSRCSADGMEIRQRERPRGPWRGADERKQGVEVVGLERDTETLGKSLEDQDKIWSAIDYYRQVVQQYPGAPQAKTAAARIQVLRERN